MIEIEPLYTTEAIATGGGRNGHVRTADGRVDMDLAIPAEMGGSGDGANPEQLFAAGYSACFIGAMRAVAARQKLDLPQDLSVDAEVDLGPVGQAFGIAVRLAVHLPGPQVRDLARAQRREACVADAHAAAGGRGDAGVLGHHEQRHVAGGVHLDVGVLEHHAAAGPRHARGEVGLEPLDSEVRGRLAPPQGLGVVEDGRAQTDGHGSSVATVIPCAGQARGRRSRCQPFRA